MAKMLVLSVFISRLLNLLNIRKLIWFLEFSEIHLYRFIRGIKD